MSMLKDKLMKHLAKKGAKDLDPMDKEAKMGVIKELGRQAGSMMSGKVSAGHPMMKAEVASDSTHGLHEGLQKADALLQHAGGPESVADHTGSPADMEADEATENSPEPMMADSHEGDAPQAESEEELAEEHADKSPEELDAHIQKLTALKHKKQSGRA